LLKRPVNEITTVEVAEVLRPVLDTKPEVARKLLPAIRRVFEYARVELRDKHSIEMLHNPANWTDLRALRLTTPQRLSRGSHAALGYTEMRAFMAELRNVDTVGARALEFLVLTNVRTDAVLKSKWLDIDLENEIWTVPLADLKDAKYRKSGFRVPLSSTLVALLKKRKEHRISNYIFPSSDPKKPLSNQVMLMTLRRMDDPDAPRWVDPETRRPITAHGFRASFRTWAEERMAVPHAVIEEAMGHKVVNNVERAYRRTDVLEPRRLLMEAWAQHCDPLTSGNVISIHSR